MAKDFKEIDYTDFQNWLLEHTPVFAMQVGKINKKLGADLNGNSVVWHNDKIVGKFIQPTKAVDFYNSIKE